MIHPYVSENFPKLEGEDLNSFINHTILGQPDVFNIVKKKGLPDIVEKFGVVADYPSYALHHFSRHEKNIDKE